MAGKWVNWWEAGSDHGDPRWLLGEPRPRPVAAEVQASLSCPALSLPEPFHYLSFQVLFRHTRAPATCHRTMGLCVSRGRVSLSGAYKGPTSATPSVTGKTGTHQKEPMRPRLQMKREGGCWMRREKRPSHCKHLTLPLTFMRNSSLRLCGISVPGARAEALCRNDPSSPPDEVREHSTRIPSCDPECHSRAPLYCYVIRR